MFCLELAMDMGITGRRGIRERGNGPLEDTSD